MAQGSNVPPPMPSDIVPSSEGAGGIGSSTVMFARADHQHPRITSSRPLTLNASGQGVATFSKPFTNEPVPTFSQMPGGVAGPCIFAVESWIMTGDEYTGANIRGWKLAAPTQTLASVNVVGIAVTVGGQSITTYGPAAGAKVSVIMLPDSGV
jgi:hypothetical protein